MESYLVLVPEVVVLVAALLAMFADRLGGDRAAAVIGMLATAAATVLVWIVPAPDVLFGGMLSFEGGAAGLVVRSAITAFTALFLLWVFARGWSGFAARDAVSLVLFSTAGSMLLVSANDLVVLFMALELATMPTYVLLGYRREESRGLEGALKYLLLSMMTSLLMAYGLSFVYGLNGSTAYSPIDGGAGNLALFAGMLVVVGFLAKMSAAPFHYWAPDASEGALAPAVGYVMTIAKIAPMWALVRFLVEVLPRVEALSSAILVASVVSIVWGNLAALPQTDIRRMIAYSGIANAGYMLLGVAAGTASGYASAVFFVVVYVVSVLGLLLVIGQEGPGLADVAGLVRRRPYAAWSSVAFLFSLMGFPPLVGFYGKLAVFSAAFHNGHVVSVVIAVLFTVVSAGYAFNVLRAMFTPGEGAPAENTGPMFESTVAYPQSPVLAATVVIALAVATIALGIVTEPVVALLRAALL